ncbi:RpiB/LacA/LacB family sugar-phosphate isomerase [Candidatus Micrarchaeota archaeon]|nr:RpiB/LacA/LacB family sugar-phosphate isomerase [Candidatus Micrarchaeota archaeon]
MDKIIEVKGFKVPIGDHRRKMIVIGSDHRGFYNIEKDFYPKALLMDYLKQEGFVIIDVGTHSKERCDYPKYSFKIGEIVSDDSELQTVGIGLCGSGIGIGTIATKFNGIYPVFCENTKMAANSRMHNNTNLLTIGVDEKSPEELIKIVQVWLNTPFYTDFENERVYLERFVQTLEFERQIARINQNS